MITSAKLKVESLAKKNGCDLTIHPNGSIYLDAPRGKQFRSCQSAAISIPGAPVGTIRPNWKAALDFFSSEIAEGFEMQ